MGCGLLTIALRGRDSRALTHRELALVVGEGRCVNMFSLKIIAPRSRLLNARLRAVAVVTGYTDNSSTKSRKWFHVSITYTCVRAADGSDVRKAVGGLL